LRSNLHRVVHRRHTSDAHGDAGGELSFYGMGWVMQRQQSMYDHADQDCLSFGDVQSCTSGGLYFERELRWNRRRHSHQQSGGNQLWSNLHGIIRNRQASDTYGDAISEFCFRWLGRAVQRQQNMYDHSNQEYIGLSEVQPRTANKLNFERDLEWNGSRIGQQQSRGNKLRSNLHRIIHHRHASDAYRGAISEFCFRGMGRVMQRHSSVRDYADEDHVGFRDV
jgi:hypothetical protein